MNNKYESLPKGLLDELERLTIPFFIVDYAIGKILFANQATEHMLGHSKNFYYEKGLEFFMSLTHPEDMVWISNEMAGIIQDIVSTPYDPFKIKLYHFENMLQHANGSWVWAEIETYVLNIDKDGFPSKIICILKEITERKAKENLLWNELKKREPSVEKLNQIRADYEAIKKADVMPSSSSFIPMTFRNDPVRTLSNREKEVLQLIAKGQSTQEIASNLFISFNTVEAHRKNLLKKFVVKNVAELVKEASRSYWLGS